MLRNLSANAKIIMPFLLCLQLNSYVSQIVVFHALSGHGAGHFSGSGRGGYETRLTVNRRYVN